VNTLTIYSTPDDKSSWALALDEFVSEKQQRPDPEYYRLHPAYFPLSQAIVFRRIAGREDAGDLAARMLFLIVNSYNEFRACDAAQNWSANSDVLRNWNWRDKSEAETRNREFLAELIDIQEPSCKKTAAVWSLIQSTDAPNMNDLTNETELDEEEIARAARNATEKLTRLVGAGMIREKPAPEKMAFPLVAVGEIEITEPEFLVDGLLETNTLAEIFGDPGCGKSFAAIDLASCVASGLPFHGRDVKQGPVIYLAGEGKSGLVKRFAAWCQHNVITDRQAVPLYISERPANFLDPETNSALGNACDAVAQYSGVPALIVVDTVARSFGGGDENSTMDMGQFICAVDDLRVRYPDAVILLVHHTGHAEKSRARGSMALKGALDAEYRVEKQDATVTITCTKMKDAPEPAPIAFELQDVKLGIDRKGREFGSAVLVETQAKSRAKAGKLTPARQLAVDTFKEAAQESGVREGGAFLGVYLEDWRPVFYRKHTGATTDAKRKAFDRARQDRSLFDCNDDLYQLKGNGVEGLL
jgi:hypothetical protein